MLTSEDPWPERADKSPGTGDVLTSGSRRLERADKRRRSRRAENQSSNGPPRSWTGSLPPTFTFTRTSPSFRGGGLLLPPEGAPPGSLVGGGLEGEGLDGEGLDGEAVSS